MFTKIIARVDVQDECVVLVIMLTRDSGQEWSLVSESASPVCKKVRNGVDPVAAVLSCSGDPRLSEFDIVKMHDPMRLLSISQSASSIGGLCSRQWPRPIAILYQDDQGELARFKKQESNDQTHDRQIRRIRKLIDLRQLTTFEDSPVCTDVVILHENKESS
jgi:hypothetical protein